MPGQAGDDDLVWAVVAAAVDELDAPAEPFADLVCREGRSLPAFSWTADLLQTLRTHRHNG